MKDTLREGKLQKRSKPRTKSAANKEEPLFTVRTPLRQTEDQVSGCNKLRQTVNPHSRSMSHFASDQRNSEEKGNKGSFTFQPQQKGDSKTRHELNGEPYINICEPRENYWTGELGRNTSFERTPTNFTRQFSRSNPCWDKLKIKFQGATNRARLSTLTA